jgi:hypothetical protein
LRNGSNSQGSTKSKLFIQNKVTPKAKITNFSSYGFTINNKVYRKSSKNDKTPPRTKSNNQGNNYLMQTVSSSKKRLMIAPTLTGTAGGQGSSIIPQQ